MILKIQPKIKTEKTNEAVTIKTSRYFILKISELWKFLDNLRFKGKKATTFVYLNL